MFNVIGTEVSAERGTVPWRASLVGELTSSGCSRGRTVNRPLTIGMFRGSPTFESVLPCNPQRVARTLLIVDDDAGFSDLAARVVTGWGHAVIGLAGSVAEGLARAAALRPEMVLVDIGLPDGDGFSLTEQLIAMPWPMRVILISSDSDPANRAAARRAGASGFVPKDELSGIELRELLEQG